MMEGTYKMDYTVEIYKEDKRYHKGERLFFKIDYKDTDKQDLVKLCQKNYPGNKYRFEIFETWVVKKNFMSGVEFKERYDTPYYCSPSSETYWSS